MSDNNDEEQSEAKYKKKVEGTEVQCDTDSVENREDEETAAHNHEKIAPINLRENQKKLLDEMASTEDSYVTDLEMIKECINKVQGSIEIAKKAIMNKGKEQLDKLCTAIRDLCRIHYELKIRLKTALSKQSEDIADIYEDFCKDLTIYVDYVNVYFDCHLNKVDQQEQAIFWHRELFNQIQKVERFKGMQTQSTLFIPIQRLMRYDLLLTTFLRRIDDDQHPNVTKLRDALEKIRLATREVDRHSGIKANIHKLMELQSRIKKTDILIQSREFRLETAVSRIDANGQLTTVKQKLFLFNDVLLVCDEPEPYIVKHEIPTDSLKIVESTDLNQLIQTDKSTVLCFWGSGIDKAFTFQFENLRTRNEWLQAITETSSQSKEVNHLDAGDISQPPVFVPVNCVTKCLLCRCLFGLIVTKHQCRACGNVFCSKCSKNKLILPYSRGQKVRVCNDCFDLRTALENSRNVNASNSSN